MAPKHLFLCIAELLAFQALRILITCLQYIKWMLDGTYAQIRASRRPENFGRSAQVLRVKSWFVFDYWVMYNGPTNLILSHDRFVHPNYILKDEVSLYCLTKDEALFVEAPPGVEVWKKKYSAFHKIAQHEYGRFVIRMPLRSFYKLVDEMGELEAKLLFIEFFPRSGSTLMCQLFEETGVCVSYSEAHVLNQVWGKDAHGNSPGEVTRRLEGAVKMLCKPRKQPTSAFVFKIGHLTDNPLTPYLTKSFPRAKFLYIYRDPIPNLISAYKAMLTVNTMRVMNSMHSFTSMWIKLNKKLTEFANMPMNPEVIQIIEKSKFSMPMLIYFGWAQNIIAYLQEQRTAKYPFTPPIKYEDIVSNPRESTKIIFEYSGLPLDLVDKAMKAFETDSQAGTSLSRKEFSKHSISGLGLESLDTKQNLDEMSRVMGLPSPHKEFRLPNTLTTPGKAYYGGKLSEGT